MYFDFNNLLQIQMGEARIGQCRFLPCKNRVSMEKFTA